VAVLPEIVESVMVASRAVVLVSYTEMPPLDPAVLPVTVERSTDPPGRR